MGKLARDPEMLRLMEFLQMSTALEDNHPQRGEADEQGLFGQQQAASDKIQESRCAFVSLTGVQSTCRFIFGGA